jgi:hypothetical protein
MTAEDRRATLAIWRTAEVLDCHILVWRGQSKPRPLVIDGETLEHASRRAERAYGRPAANLARGRHAAFRRRDPGGGQL